MPLLASPRLVASTVRTFILCRAEESGYSVSEWRSTNGESLAEVSVRQLGRQLGALTLRAGGLPFGGQGDMTLKGASGPPSTHTSAVPFILPSQVSGSWGCEAATLGPGPLSGASAALSLSMRSVTSGSGSALYDGDGYSRAVARALRGVLPGPLPASRLAPLADAAGAENPGRRLPLSSTLTTRFSFPVPRRALSCRLNRIPTSWHS